MIQSVQFNSVAQSCLTLCNPIDCSSPSFPVCHQFPEFTQTHVHWVVIPSNHLILCPPLLLPSIFSNIRIFSNESALHIQWPEYYSFSFSLSPSNEHSGLISWWTGWISLQSKGLSRVSPTPQFKSINSLALSFLYSPTLTSIHDCWKKQWPWLDEPLLAK